MYDHRNVRPERRRKPRRTSRLVLDAGRATTFDDAVRIARVIEARQRDRQLRSMAREGVGRVFTRDQVLARSQA